MLLLLSEFPAIFDNFYFHLHKLRDEDIGQIEGAFMQGLGYVTTEQMLRSRETGEMLSTGPGNYKVMF